MTDAEKKERRIHPCWFCEGTNLEVRDTPFVGFTVRCWNDTCLASGPYKSTAEEAIEAWNRRTQNKQCKHADICRLYAEQEG